MSSNIEYSEATKSILLEVTEAFIVRAVQEACEIAENRGPLPTKSKKKKKSTKDDGNTLQVNDVRVAIEKLHRLPSMDIPGQQ